MAAITICSDFGAPQNKVWQFPLLLLNVRACLYPPLGGAKLLSVATAVVKTGLPGFLFGAPPVLVLLWHSGCFLCSIDTRNKQVWWFLVVILTACIWGLWGYLVVIAARDFLVLPPSYCFVFIFVLMRICEIPKPDTAAISPTTHTPLSYFCMGLCLCFLLFSCCSDMCACLLSLYSQTLSAMGAQEQHLEI